MKLLIIASFFISSSSFARVLPSIFYNAKEKKEEFCKLKEYHSENFWRALTKIKMNKLSHDRSPTAANSFVTKSYLEIFRHTPKINGVKYMGYIYANASHHLGRLVRYNAWPENHPLKEKDRSYVEGPTLRTMALVANTKLSSKLMNYSKDLYQELSWSLLSASLCGLEYTQKMVRDRNLIKAYTATTISDFVEAFVTYEQTYLHKTMYQDLEIKIPAKAMILDNMRYMTFNGERHVNFFEWCRMNSCNTSSYNLENRIRYDVWAILSELKLTQSRLSVLNTRLQNAKVEATAEYFSKRP